MTTTAIVGVWLGLGGVALVLQIMGVAAGTPRFPTFGEAAAFVMRRMPGRVLVLAAWVWLGWHTFVRSHVGGP